MILKSKGSSDLGISTLGLPKKLLAPFMALHRKFKVSLEWILLNPDKLDEETVNRFFEKVVAPMDTAWEKMPSDLRLTLIRRKAV